MPRAVWVDTDIALGAPAGDVDDAFALAAVVRAPSLRLLGVSTVFGNTTARRSTACAERLLAEAGSTATVIEGAARAGQMSAAAEAIAALPAGTSVLALGPLTNVAAALARDPSLASRITVSLVGGNLSSWGRWPPLWPFEFNLAKDAPAAHALFDSATPRRVYPLDACRALTIGPRALARIARSSPLGRYLARGSLRWLAYAPIRYRSLSFPLWDLVPALDAADLLSGHTEKRRLRVEGRGLLVEDGAAPVATCLRSLPRSSGIAALEHLLSET